MMEVPMSIGRSIRKSLQASPNSLRNIQISPMRSTSRRRLTQATQEYRRRAGKIRNQLLKEAKALRTKIAKAGPQEKANLASDLNYVYYKLDLIEEIGPDE